MEKKNYKQIYQSGSKGNTFSYQNNTKKPQKPSRKCLKYQKILTQGVNRPEMIYRFAHFAKERVSQSQHQKIDSQQKVKTAANTMSSWSLEASSKLCRQMSSMNKQMKDQNDRIKRFIIQLQPQLDIKFSVYKYNSSNKVSLSQKIKNQSLMLRQIASPRLFK